MKQTSQQQLIAILRYELEYANIDPRKCLEFTIESNPSAAGYIVKFTWYDGIVTDSELDPTLQREDKYIECDDYFRILKNESLTKLRRYIEDFINGSILLEFKEERF